MEQSHSGDPLKTRAISENIQPRNIFTFLMIWVLILLISYLGLFRVSYCVWCWLDSLITDIHPCTSPALGAKLYALHQLKYLVLWIPLANERKWQTQKMSLRGVFPVFSLLLHWAMEEAVLFYDHGGSFWWPDLYILYNLQDTENVFFFFSFPTSSGLDMGVGNIEH